VVSVAEQNADAGFVGVTGTGPRPGLQPMVKGARLICQPDDAMESSPGAAGRAVIAAATGNLAGLRVGGVQGL